jgi:hypothetical protein
MFHLLEDSMLLCVHYCILFPFLGASRAYSHRHCRYGQHPIQPPATDCPQICNSGWLPSPFLGYTLPRNKKTSVLAPEKGERGGDSSG